MRFDKIRQFEVLNAVLAAAEERGTVSLAEFAERFDVDLDALHRVVADAVLCEFKTSTGDVIGFTRSFLLTEDEHLVLDESHWLRDLVSVPPEPEAALRLLLAGSAASALAPAAVPPLDSALEKLRSALSAEVVVTDARPEWLPLVEHARRAHKRLRFRYVKDGHTEASDREIEPHIVFSKWGHWYVGGRPVGAETTPSFRIDRIISAEVSDEEFEPVDTPTIPEWFDLSAAEHSVRLRLPRGELTSLPRPHRLGEISELPDGLVEVEVVITGDRRLDHLLVILGPECEVLGPPKAIDRRRAYTEELLALY
ncbi:MAG: WYL domain-containing protein [Acidimicrobiia bacterium]|nr:WYL domain-containing protein [Acidimicrobiia bacterium]